MTLKPREACITDFLAFVPESADPNACWPWGGPCGKHGYGDFNRGGSHLDGRAHRAAWQVFRGLIPEGQHVLHECDRPDCINPGHLYLGTHARNMVDRDAKDRVVHGSRHKKAKLDEFDVAWIVQSYADTRPEARAQSKLAREFGITQPRVSQLVNGQGWTRLFRKKNRTAGDRKRRAVVAFRLHEDLNRRAAVGCHGGKLNGGFARIAVIIA